MNIVVSPAADAIAPNSMGPTMRVRFSAVSRNPMASVERPAGECAYIIIIAIGREKPMPRPDMNAASPMVNGSWQNGISIKPAPATPKAQANTV